MAIPLLASDKDIIDIILAIIQIFTLIFLIIYVWKTYDMAVSTEKSAEVSKLTLQEMKETRDQEIAPYVVAYFEFENQTINLVIENVGKGLAKNVKIEFDPKLVNSFPDHDINDVAFIKEGIGSMPPNYKIETFFDSAIDYYGNEEFPSKYNAKITYYGGLNETKRITKYILDIGSHYNILFSTKKGFNEVVKELERISKAQESINKEFSSYNNNFPKGIWIKNPQSPINNSDFVLTDHKILLLAKLKEFKILWESVYKKEENKFGSFYTDIGNRFSSLGMQILIMSSYESSNELNDLLIDIGTKLFKLERVRFSWGIEEVFTKSGNEISELVDKAIEELK
ncbi:hypothetical protein [Methanobacterium formicicum]|uniref:Uncharacterized protein n=1 Tax=Methanobacterium formicicum TaxID=2162 RepID=A0A089ZG15_METFO|nr:hypothetical protein [Methanobacterium formicicum]AIS30988.1 hypothetical protein BRM9_0159 [Methanobacterium formicicum]CEL23780.1 hypothetical protein MB9_0124 [Methanobacterium formicicum]